MNSRQRSVAIRVSIALVVFTYVAFVAWKTIPRFDFAVVMSFVGLYLGWNLLAETVLYQDPDVEVVEDEDQWSYAILQFTSLIGLFYAAFDFASEHWTRMYSLEPAIVYTGIILFIISCVERWWGFRAIGKYFNPRIAVYEGHQLTASGPYRYIRHPLYLGVMLNQIAIPMVLSSWGGLIIVFVAILPALIYRIKLEEDFLIKHFGDRYRDYMSITKRLIPGIW